MHETCPFFSSYAIKGAEALASNSTLRSLSLACNTIGSAARFLWEGNSSLTSLRLARNAIPASALALLPLNSSLTRISLSYNPVGDEGAALLAVPFLPLAANIDHTLLSESFASGNELPMKEDTTVIEAGGAVSCAAGSARGWGDGHWRLRPLPELHAHFSQSLRERYWYSLSFCQAGLLVDL
jgi:hypothetical protein